MGGCWHDAPLPWGCQGYPLASATTLVSYVCLSSAPTLKSKTWIGPSRWLLSPEQPSLTKAYGGFLRRRPLCTGWFGYLFDKSFNHPGSHATDIPPQLVATLILDPPVNLLIDRGDRRQADARFLGSKRSHKKKERERAQKCKPQRINLDLPLDLKKRLEAQAKREGVPASQLVAFLLYEPLHLLETRAISLWGYKTASHCPKFECNLDLKRRAEELLLSQK
jgi:hypothetical protein